MVVDVSCGYLMTLGSDVAIDRLGPYSAALPPLYAQFGGRYLAMGGPGRGVAAIGSPPRSVMLARFASLGDVHSFWHSPGYRAAVPLRAGCGDFTVFALAGDEIASTATILHVGLGARPAGLPVPFAEAPVPDVIEGTFTGGLCLWAVDRPDAALDGVIGYRVPLRVGDKA